VESSNKALTAGIHATRHYGFSGARAAKHCCFRPGTSPPWAEDETTAADDKRQRDAPVGRSGADCSYRVEAGATDYRLTPAKLDANAVT
jgi:hypothetical protein